MPDDKKIKNYCISEQRAVLVHRYYLGLKLNHEPTEEEIIESWENSCGPDWRRKKMKIDCNDQIREIEKHKYFLSQEKGSDIGISDATTDWITRYAKKWRTYRENDPSKNNLL